MLLQELPKVLFLEMITPMKKPYPNLPAKWFPMTPQGNDWCLDPEERIIIHRRGYPLVPDFSTTIDAATGQTLETAIPDLGDAFCPPSQHAAMRGYIALSRVTAADGLLVAQPFSPLLFSMGPQSWPTLLFNVLQGRVPLYRLHAECEDAAKASNTTAKMKERAWVCTSCKYDLP